MNISAQQIIQILFLVFIVIGPVIVKVIKSAQQAKERRRLEQQRQFQINEAMRTGRPVEQVMVSTNPASGPFAPPPVLNPGAASAQDRLRELAARRQAQIDALRRQRAGGGPAPAAPGPTNAYQNQPNTSPFPVVRQQTGQASGARPPQAARPAAQQVNRGPTKAQRRQAVIDAERAKEAREWNPPSGKIGGSSHDHDGDVTHRLVPDSPVEGTTATGNRAAPGEAVRAASFSPTDLRRAVVLREVLAPPVSLRGDRDGV